MNNLGRAGELWTSTEHGLWHSTDFGKTVIGLSGGLTQAWSVATGAPATAGGQPTLFVAGVGNGKYGLFRSDNGGASSWTRAFPSVYTKVTRISNTNFSEINDAAHGFASTSGALLAGDPRIYKR